MEKKQTAVEFLAEEIKKHHPFWIDIIKKAKEMEKEQINTSYGVGYGDAIFYKENKIMPPYDLNSTYYDITYGKETDRSRMD